MVPKHQLHFIAGLITILSAAGCVPSGNLTTEAEALWRLDNVTDAIQRELNTVDRDLAAAADSIMLTGLDSPPTREVLNQLIAKYACTVDAATVDPNGILVAIEPSAYQDSQGADISDQQQVVRLHATLQPVLSLLFMAVEGIPGMDLEWPLFNGYGLLTGSVSLFFNPTDLLAPIVAPEVAGSRFACWLMQTNGIILYDADPGEIGRVLFTDPLYASYTELLALGQQMVEHPSGSGSYTFLANEATTPVTKLAWWQTVGLHGTEWRVVLIREER
jgi:hypothetical protein